MSPQARRKIIKNIEARVLPLTVLAMFVLAGLTAVFIVNPGNENIVSAATVDQFLYYKEITFDHNQIPSSQTDFPVLINLSSDADLASDCLSSGWDIAFFDASNNQLAHEIELFDDGTGQLVAWVNVTDLQNGADTTINMYYGDSDIGSSAENPSGTWHSDFKGVWLCDDVDNYCNDSTSNSNSGTEEGNPTYQQTSDDIIGYGIALDGTGDGFYLPDDLDITTPITEITVITRASLTEYDGSNTRRLINFLYYYIIPFEYIAGDDAIETYTRSSTGTNYFTSEHNNVDDSGFYTYTYAYDKDLSGDEQKGYKDNTLIEELSATDIERDGSAYSNTLGMKYDGASEYWKGTMDYVFLIDGYRNDSFIRTHVNNILNATDGGFFTLGSESGNVEGSYGISGLDGDTRFLHGASGGVLAGDTNISTLVMKVYSNTSGTTDNCTSIFLDFSGGYPSGYTAGNFSFQVRNTSDGTFTTNWNTVTGNMTLNSTTWSNNWAYGTDPFPINGYNSTIEVRMRVEIPSSASVGTNTSDSWIVKWLIDDL